MSRSQQLGQRVVGRWFSSLLCLGVAAACGGDGGGGAGSGGGAGGSAGTGGGGSAGTGGSDGGTVSERIGPEGGTVSTADGAAEVIIPPDALSAPTTVSIVTLARDAQPQPETILSGVYDFLPDGLAFAAPVTIRIRVVPAQTPVGARLAYVDGGEWVTVDGAALEGERMTGEVDHFTPFAVLAPRVGGGSFNPDPTCLRVDRLDATKVVPPAGVQVSFRVLDCDGNAVRPLNADEVTLINDESGVPFNDSSEGGSASPLSSSDETELYSVLVLDMSNSIANNPDNPNAQDDVIDGAQSFVNAVTSADGDPGTYTHEVAIIAFGSTSLTQVEQPFTSDRSALIAVLDGLRDEPGRGTTNLYGAYSQAINLVAGRGSPDAVVERFVILMTDGTHEAGDQDNLRAQALALKDASDVRIYSVGVQGDYDSCKLEELATSGCRVGAACDPSQPPPDTCFDFISVDQTSALEDAFQAVSARALGVARSNYVVGVCTPVELGNPTLSVAIDLDGLTASASAPYSTASLTGDVTACDGAAIAAGPLYCSGGVCQVVCIGMSCGTDLGVSCGRCASSASCSQNVCVPICGDGVRLSTEICDDGFADDCGSCNEDCSGPGTGSLCGDGVQCPETEACDDGFTDACGSCAGDCSGSGSGAACGDGQLCPESEECDDGSTDACGSCNASCTGAGSGATCGDGQHCPELEVCDDGGTDACGACDATCAAPGSLATCGAGTSCSAAGACADIDDCVPGACYPGVTCNDNVAPARGFSCGSCPGLMSGNGITCTCIAGAEPFGAGCRDIDGCAGSPCFAGVVCTDRAAPQTGHSCGPCPSPMTGDGVTCSCPTGTTYDAASNGCNEVDGCAGGPCYSGVSCTDVPSPGTGYTCGPCPAPLQGNGISCACPTGTSYDAGSNTCPDINGCAGSPCYAGVTCTDVPAPGAGFTCGACPAPLQGNGITCTCPSGTSYDAGSNTCLEINGCAGSPCYAGVTCTDVPAPGSGFTCGPCPAPLQGNGVTCACPPGTAYDAGSNTCPDINGCATGPCYPGVTCTDVPAPGTGYSCGPCPAPLEGNGISCQCPYGTVPNGSTCDELDSCAGNPCPIGTCYDLPSPQIGYTCGRCTLPQVGDGQECFQVVDLAVADTHSCFMLASGEVRCFQASQTPLTGISNAVAVESVGTFISVLRADLSIVYMNSSLTQWTHALSGVSPIAHGISFFCGVVAGTGEVRCNGDNSYGQLGQGNTTIYSNTVTVMGPVSGNLTGVTQISSGDSFTCALSGGQVYCWGRNNAGQIGDGSTTNRTRPFAVPGITGALSVAAGGSHACAALSTGAVKCWGNNANGQLGDTTTQQRSSPVDVSGLSGMNRVFLGPSQSCAVPAGGGNAWCWGRNDTGQIGDSAFALTQSTPVQHPLASLQKMSIGTYTGCAILTTGAVKCWGSSTWGQGGQGVTNGNPRDVALDVIW